jgi:hypothetical protein
MSGYTKLFNSILASTIWREDNVTRIVWVTLLAMCNRDGVVEGSVPGIADMARVSLPECEAALSKLQEPDPYSRTTEFEGRRIDKVSGGYVVLNYPKYRHKMSADERREYFRIKKQEERARKKGLMPSESAADMSKNVKQSQGQSKTVSDVSHLSHNTEAEAKAKEEELKEKPYAHQDELGTPTKTRTQKLKDWFERTWKEHPRKVGKAEAFVEYQKLFGKSPDESLAVLIHLALLEVKPEYERLIQAGDSHSVIHFCRFLSKKRYLDFEDKLRPRVEAILRPEPEEIEA